MITILGATGKIGGAAAEALRERGISTRAVVRDRAKAERLESTGCEIVVADMLDRAALSRAMAGADAVLGLCPISPKTENVHHDAARLTESLAAALEAARPRHAVVISDYGAHVPSGTGITLLFHHLEARLAKLPVAMTFLRSAEHMQNWARQIPVALKTGSLPTLHHPLTKTFPTVSAFDVGAVAAELLSSTPRHEKPRVLHVEGPVRYSSIDVARAVETIVEKPIAAAELPREQWEAVLRGGGVNGTYARAVAEMQDAHNAGQIDVEPGGEVVLGNTGIASVLAAAIKKR
jgi:uncharacterized protein YbjT (DUF2867 family)